MKVCVEIVEVHRQLIELEVLSDATRDEITKAAEKLANNADECNLEYSHTLGHDKWIVRDERGNFFGDKKFGQHMINSSLRDRG